MKRNKRTIVKGGRVRLSRSGVRRMIMAVAMSQTTRGKRAKIVDTKPDDNKDDCHAQMKRTEREATMLLGQSYDALMRLSESRQRCKMSHSRISGVAQELKELIKVMRVCC
jgi:hypothetical protein